MITVVLPIGPRPEHRVYLEECMESLQAQTFRDFEVRLILDGGDLARPNKAIAGVWHISHLLPWTVGPAAAWNLGVGWARHQLCFLMGADDRLEPDCLAECWAAWEAKRDDLGYYYVGVAYSDGRPDQTVPCNAAMVHKRLWRRLGGFPPESAVGAMDAAVVSIMLKHGDHAGNLIPVADGRPLYWHRIHEHQHTASRGPWRGVIGQVRHLVTELWEPHDG